MSLTSEQLSKLIQLYAVSVVDGMDVRDLCSFAIDTICDNMDGMSESEVLQEITDLFDENVVNELIESVQD